MIILTAKPAVCNIKVTWPRIQGWSSVRPLLLRCLAWGPARVLTVRRSYRCYLEIKSIRDVVAYPLRRSKGGPGMREMLNPTSAIIGMGLIQRSTDNR